MTEQNVITVTKTGHVQSYVGPKAVDLFRVRILRSSIDLHRKTGLIPTRGVTITKMLALATEYTGRKYKRGQHAQALADLDVVVSDRAVEIPVVAV